MIIKKTTIIEAEFIDELELNPSDFINCDTISQLEFEISRKFTDRSEGEKRREISKKLDIPEDFISVWKELVGFIPNNVMTLRRKNQVLNLDGIYTEINTGNYLNSRKHTWSWNTFDMGEYRDFSFVSDKHYKCYLSDSDHWDHTSTQLLFAEEID